MRRKRAEIIALATGLALGAVARLDAAESWLGPDGGSWSDPANWLGDPPDNGDVPWFIRDGDTINVNLDLANVTLDGMLFNSPGRFLVGYAAPGNSITLTGSATLDVQRSESPSPQFTTLGHSIDVQLVGSAGLHKIGDGAVNLGFVLNTYTGGTTISGGTLSAGSDAAFGNVAGSITLNGGALRGSNINSSRDLLVLGDSTIDVQTSVTFGGSVSGAGALNKTGAFGSLTFTGAIAHTGAINVHAGTLVLSGNAAAVNAPSMLAGGTIVLNNAATNNSNRIGNATPITFLGSGLTVTGNSGGNTQETIGTATFASGITFVSAQPVAASSVQLTMTSTSRVDRATAFFRGNSLGQTPPANVGQIFFTSPPALIGGGGAAGSTNISIIPWAWGGSSNTIASTDGGNSFVTYGIAGVRPLSSGEYVTSISAGVSTNNVSIGTNAVVNSSATFNSLRIVHPLSNPITIQGSGTLGITSGAILELGGQGTINNAVDFGSAEGVVHATVRLTMNGMISGSNGLTKSGAGSLRLTSAASDYAGPTIVLGGDLTYTGGVTSGSPGAFGSGTSAIVLAPGGQTNPSGGGIARLWFGGSGTSIFSRDVSVRGNSSGIGGFGTSGGFAGQVIVMNGDFDVQTHLQFQGDPDTPMIINGDISGPGMVSNGFGGAQQLNGNNSYSGGTDLLGGQWIAGVSGALGTGTIWFDNPSVRLAADADDVELFNDVIFKQNFTINGSKSLSLGISIDLGGTFGHYITNTATTTYIGHLFNGGLVKFGDGLLRLAGDNTYRQGTTVNEGTLVAAYSTALGQGSVLVNAGTLKLEPDYTTAFIIQGLSVAAPGKADITNDSAAIDYRGASPLPTIVQMINDGRMISSSALPGQTIGIAEASALFPSGGTFHGISVDSTMVLLSLTFAGDSDLDGDVDVADLGSLATNWQMSAPWSGGDFDFNGSVNVNDLGLLATNWQAGVGSPPGPSWSEALASVGLPHVEVPEPTALGLVLAVTVQSHRRRRCSGI